MLKFYGVADNAALFLQNEQLKDAALWKKFVDIYRIKPDADNQGWRGEFWGKMMRGGVLVYEYTRDEELYRVLTDSVNDMMTVAEPDGRVSTYQKDAEFDSWDLWCRKYVILSCEYYLEICKDDELKQKILSFICGCADYILAHIGADKKRITSASRSWYGINSSSILEPIVRLYFLTNDRRYLDFASYIVEEGGAVGINIFELAYENKLYPYQYGVSKAYEMMSCFDGLCELYRITGTERYLDACKGLYRLLIKYEHNILGSVGYCELFVNAAEYPDSATESCDAVHWMRLCYELFSLTGEACYMESFEDAYLNAFLASVNEDGRGSAFFVRSAGRHWNAPMQCQTKYQHCCLNNVPRGFANAAEASVMENEDGYYVNLYSMSTVRFGDTMIRVGEGYFDEGDMFISVRNPKKGSKLFLRIPTWSRDFKCRVGTEMVSVDTLPQKNGYAVLELDGDTVIRLQFDLTPRVIDFAGIWRELPFEDYHVRRWTDDTSDPCGREQMVKHPMAHIRRGAVLLARSKRAFSSETEMFDGRTVNGKKTSCTASYLRPEGTLMTCRVSLASDGETKEFIMCDFASAANRPVEDVRYFTVFI